jgi:hypothetical protein
LKKREKRVAFESDSKNAKIGGNESTTNLQENIHLFGHKPVRSLDTRLYHAIGVGI